MVAGRRRAPPSRAPAAAEALEAARDARSRSLKMWFAIDTLEYLRKGGRIGAAQACLGSALQIKPILTLEEEITPVERVRTRRRAIRAARRLRPRAPRGRLRQAGSSSTSTTPRRPAQLVERCREVFGSDPVFVSEIGPVIGAHIGPGLLGSAAWTKSSWASGAARAGCRPRRAATRRSRRRSGDDLTLRSDRRCCARTCRRRAPSARRRRSRRWRRRSQLAVLAHLAAPVGELGDAARRAPARVS